MTALRVAATAAVLMTGSTVLAAKTDNLPPVIQQRAHSLFPPLGIPAPSTAGQPPATDAATPPGSDRSTEAKRPDTTPSPSGPGDLTPVLLCQAWHAAQNGTHDDILPDSVTKALRAAAGGQPSIAAFCSHVLSGNGKKATPTRPHATSTPDRTAKPGQGKGHGSR